MNEERILHLANLIRRTPHRAPTDEEIGSYLENYNDPLDAFSMSYTHCGSVGCIHGWAEYLWGGEQQGWPTLQNMLGVPHGVAGTLYMPMISADLSQITSEQAARALEEVVAQKPEDRPQMQDIWREVLGMV